MPNFALQNQRFLFFKKAKTNRVIKMILYQIHRISNTFISNNNERKNKTKMQATSEPPMNQISQHVLYLYAQSEVYHGIYADTKTNLWQIKKNLGIYLSQEGFCVFTNKTSQFRNVLLVSSNLPKKPTKISEGFLT